MYANGSVMSQVVTVRKRAPFRDVNINIMTFASKEGQMTDSGPPNGRPSV